jgi:transposase
LSVFVERTGSALQMGGGKRSRRSWSGEEKRRIVDEAFRPGASVADVARRHGLNANQVFNWRKATSTPAETAPMAVCLPAATSPRVTSVADFVPIGMFARAEDEGPALIAGASPAPVSAAPSDGAAPRQPAMDERPGVIEIDLVDGTRLRVDAFVNERALRRVLAVLKATS